MTESAPRRGPSLRREFIWPNEAEALREKIAVEVRNFPCGGAPVFIDHAYRRTRA